MKNKTYSEKLRDPRWQRKRLSILERDGWACKRCGDNETTLVVHHFAYSGEPWEVQDHLLLTICDRCHTDEHEYRAQNEKDFLKSFYAAGFLSCDLIEIADALKEYNFDTLPHVPEVISSVLGHHISDRAHFRKMVDDYFEDISKKSKEKSGEVENV